MSDHYLFYIPKIIDFEPPKDSADRAVTFLRSFAEATKVSAEITEGAKLFEGGENWSGAACPHCGAEISMDWFIETINCLPDPCPPTALTTLIRCCERPVCLNDLHFGWPAGFARFCLTAESPAIYDTTAEQDAQLEKLIETPLRKIWARI